MTTNLRPSPEISRLSAFGSAIYLFDKTCHFVPKPGTKHFVPVSCKRLQKFHTGKTSYWSELVPVSCKYPLSNPLEKTGDESVHGEGSATKRQLSLKGVPIIDLLLDVIYQQCKQKFFMRGKFSSSLRRKRCLARDIFFFMLL